MSAAGNVVFANLALIMCIGLAVGLAKKIKVLLAGGGRLIPGYECIDWCNDHGI